MLRIDFKSLESQVYSVNNGSRSCTSLPKIPLTDSQKFGSIIGGFLQEETPVVCWVNTDEPKCYGYSESELAWNHIANLTIWRRFAANVVIGSNTLWITGGEDNYGSWITDSTYNVTLSTTNPGPKLPMELSHHCMVMLESGIVMVIGGAYYNMKTVLYYDIAKEQWYNASSLKVGRMDHACTTLVDWETNTQMVLAIGGFYIDAGDETIEVFDSDSKQWSYGPSFASSSSGGSLVASQDRKRAYLMPGDTTTKSLTITSSSIVEFWCAWKHCHWKELEQSTTGPSFYGVAMLLPNSVSTNCTLNP